MAGLLTVTVCFFDAGLPLRDHGTESDPEHLNRRTIDLNGLISSLPSLFASNYYCKTLLAVARHHFVGLRSSPSSNWFQESVSFGEHCTVLVTICSVLIIP